MLGEPKTFLLVEDNDAHAKLVTWQLEATGEPVVVDRVSNGEAALDYLHSRGVFSGKTRPHVILLDLHLPRVDGHEVLREVKAHPVLRSIPVIVLSTSAAAQDTSEAYESHVNSYLVKPLDLDRLQQMMKDLVRYWSSWNQPAELAP